MPSLANLKSQRTRLSKQIDQTMDAAKTLLASEVTNENRDEIAEELDVHNELCRELRDRYEALSARIVEATDNKDNDTLEAEGEISADVLFKISGVVSRLTSRQRRILQTHAESPSANSAEPNDLASQLQALMRRESLGGEPQSAPRCTVNLPKLDFDYFSGDVLKWSEFWDVFSASVHHNAALQPVQKFAYLRTKLKGEAKSVIAGLETTNDNYDVALGLLKQRFGNRQAAISAHYSKLMDLHASPDQTDKLRQLTDLLEQELRCLSSLGEDINHSHFISLMMHKLPGQVITKLEEMKGPEEEWTVQLLRSKLQTHLTAREAAVRHNYSTFGQRKNFSNFSDDRYRTTDQRRQYNRFDGRKQEDRTNNGRSTTETLYSSENATRRQNDIKNYKVSRQQNDHRSNWTTKPRNDVTPKPCIFCKGKHWSDECQKYKTIPERKQQVSDRCFNCLGSNHKMDTCRSVKQCYHCKAVKRHHSSLCPHKGFRRTESSHVAAEPQDDCTTNESLLASGERAILQTAKVEVFSPSSQRRAKLRLLFDSGSHRSYISEDAAVLLQLQPKATETISVNTFAEKRSKNVQTKIVDIQLKLQDNSFCGITANVVPTISASMQRQPIDLSPYKELLKGVQIADPVPVKPEQGSIDILIGSDYYMDLLTFEKRPLGDHLYLLGSKFGWILAGRSSKVTKSTRDYSMLILHYNNQSVPQLNHYNQPDKSIPLNINTEDFWSLETIGIKETNDDAADERAISNFNTTVKHHDCRYFVKWPWRDEFPRLPTNFQLSMGRLKSLLKRLSTNAVLFKQYNAIIEDQLSKGVIEKVTTTCKNDSMVHYIPHQAVVKPDKSTTKVRIVYDASAKVNKDHPSLNECLLRGPVILENLCGLLMRFRLHKYAVVADIEKAFLQIGLQEEDRNVVRFLWIKDPTRKTIDDNIQIYRFSRVPFGVISSPFLLAATVMFHLSKAETCVAKQLSRDIYVDNIISGTTSEKELQDLYVEGKQLFKQASMNLREWASNCKGFSKSISNDDNCKERNIKVLGLYWNTDNDNISLAKVKCDMDNSAIRKRDVFQKIAQFFDPLGQFSPVTIRAKMFIQELWSQKVSWDDKLSQPMKTRWSDLLNDLNKLNDVSIPRYVGLPKTSDGDYSLICFCDASISAYAAVIYLRQTNNAGTKTTMMFSKSRLAPIKRQTIPRLELLAVLIGVRAIKFAEKHLQLQIKDKSLWSDSQCVLHWIKSTKLQPVFVQNRLVEIKSHTDVTFNYVKSEDNPADLPSRGMSTLDIMSSALWWDGPSWLTKDPAEWPKVEIKPENANIDGQDHAKTLFEVSLRAQEQDTIESPFGIEVSRFSSLLRLLRVTGWAVRFVQRLRQPNTNTTTEKHITTSEMTAAKQQWEKYLQSKHFPDEMQAIMDGKKSDLVRKFDLHQDTEGLIRCGGRLRQSNLRIETKFPKLLPKDNPYTSLVINHLHRKLLHAGVSQTLAELRREYWLPQGRNQVRKVLSKCVICRRWEGGPFQMPSFPSLPLCRVARTTPFTYVGVDYFGPLLTKSSTTTTKAWVCLFTCLTVRAIHLEPVHNLSADEFIMALRRFVSRRGSPVQVFSDNGTNFQAATKAVTKVLNTVANDPDVQSYISSAGTTWKFIPEFSPWMGGFYERLIGSVKRHLRKAIGRICLSPIQLQTILCEIEAVVNSRPLAYVGEEQAPGYPISPAHFLSLNPKIGTSATDDCDEISGNDDPDYFYKATTTSHLLDVWKKGHKHLNNFWKAWQSDYLVCLRERTQKHHRQTRCLSSVPPTIGDVVLVKDEVLPRGSWKVARIRTLIQSADGNYRAAGIVLTSGKHLTRPLSLLYPFESAIGDSPTRTSISTPTVPPEISNASPLPSQSQTSVDYERSVSTKPPTDFVSNDCSQDCDNILERFT